MARRSAAQHRRRAAELLAQRVDGLGEDDALDALRRARAWHSHAIYDLCDHLQAHPDALTSGESACPLSLVRLTHLLRGDGHVELVGPRCVRCGRAAKNMPGLRAEGRICVACYREVNKVACVRCGRRTKACYRRPEGLICSACRDTEPATQGACAICGDHRPLRRGPDGVRRCDRCIPRPARTCASCGAVAPATSITAEGPICDRCYRQHTARPCGRCGRIAPINVRATQDTPELCISCRPRTTGTCAVCGRDGFVNHSNRGRGEPLCQSCQPRIHHRCGMCSQLRPAQAFWPVGPVCHSCYHRTKKRPRTCGRCQNARVLIATDPAAGWICGQCAGAAVDYTCTQCGGDGRPYSGGKCDRCVLTERVDDLLAVDGSVNSQLAPLADALKQAIRADTMLAWLRQSPTAKLLLRLAASKTAITHDLLDQLPQTQHLHQARHLLVRTGTLPERAEHLDRINPWLSQLLSGVPSSHAAIVRPYARWFLLHRARRRAAKRGMSAAACYYLRGHIRTVLGFLAWLDHHDIRLPNITQPQVDAWLVTGAPSKRYRIRQFLTWAHRHGLASNVTTPPDKIGKSSIRPLDEDELWRQLHSCLHEDSKPLDVRVAGALILLYGTTPARLTQLTTSHVSQRGQDVWLTVGRKPILLQPPLSQLVAQLAAAPMNMSNLPHTPNTNPQPLFPGRATSLPMRPSGLRDRLTRHGIDTGPGRQTALLALAEDLPAPVVADLLGLKPDTALCWAAHTATDWTHYIAARSVDPTT